jgi:hypothetical protein
LLTSFTRIILNLCSDRLAATKDFYIALLDCEVNYDSDWYIQLRSPHNPSLEFGIFSAIIRWFQRHIK